MTKQALIVIDVQNDYFPDGKYPLHETNATAQKNVEAIQAAKARAIPVIHVQHLVSPELGEGLFFYDESEGAEIHASILAAAPDAPVIVKRHADCFENTNLDQLLEELGVEEIILAGMMTHNCVTHTALSPAASKYNPKVIGECCCTVDPIAHALAVDSMQVRGIPFVDIANAF